MANSISEIEDLVRMKSSSADRLVRGIWNTKCLFSPPNNGRIFNYRFIVSQTLGQGCAYTLNSTEEDFIDLIGKDFLTCDSKDCAMRVSLLDSMFSSFSKEKVHSCITKTGSSTDKLKWRTEIIYEEAQRLLGGTKKKLIVNVGVVGDILATFSQNNYEIIGTDFDESIIGKETFPFSQIYHGSRTLEFVAAADLAIVTGMTIVTQTIDDIIQCCVQNNTKLIVFAETGANFGDFYLGKGVDVFLGELYPFYIFNGTSSIEVSRAK